MDMTTHACFVLLFHSFFSFFWQNIMLNDKFIAPQRNRLSKIERERKRKSPTNFQRKENWKTRVLKRTRKCLFQIDYQETRPIEQIPKWRRKKIRRIDKSCKYRRGGLFHKTHFVVNIMQMIFSTLKLWSDPFSMNKSDDSVERVFKVVTRHNVIVRIGLTDPGHFKAVNIFWSISRYRLGHS